ncbi:MAG: hypothetical protein MZU95_15530 [Desulfomicrobium escambiense]|nr:hypothetical protein [Desulfomicrobium escambiense]
MPASLRSRFWKAAIRAAFKDKELSIPELRARSERNGRVHPPFPKDVGTEDLVLDGLRCAAIRPARDAGKGRPLPARRRVRDGFDRVVPDALRCPCPGRSACESWCRSIAWPRSIPTPRPSRTR